MKVKKSDSVSFVSKLCPSDHFFVMSLCAHPFNQAGDITETVGVMLLDEGISSWYRESPVPASASRYCCRTVECEPLKDEGVLRRTRHVD